ncbi:MAG: serine/threonine-protein phosphatase [Prevotella sp.]|nr:serine/threonine-protein phosphatase [Prevotella sp.]
MKISIHAKTDVGRGRDNNEDAYTFCPDLTGPSWSADHTKGYIPLGSLGTLLVVADGMGGLNAGEVAAAVAIDTVRHAFTTEAASKALGSDETAVKLLTQTVKDADEAINRRMIASPETAGMGTTIVLCWITSQNAYVAWCGDSRCYRYNADDGGLHALTKDHSYVQELVDRGEITEEQAFTHPDNNIITRGLGDFASEVQPDIVVSAVKAGDMFLLCSDGLCGYCTNEQIGQILANSEGDVARCADDLIRTALDVPGDDNICIVVASVLADDQPEPGGSKIMHLLRSLFG